MISHFADTPALAFNSRNRDVSDDPDRNPLDRRGLGGCVEGATAGHAGAKPEGGLSLRAGDGPGVWFLRFPIPPEVISDGVQTFVISDAATNAVVATFSLLAGDVLDHDLRAEISLLRAELDMLKRAFRRHCAETA
jgi:hypothetical protein